MQNPPLKLGMTYLHMWLFVQLPFTGDLSKTGPLRIFFVQKLNCLTLGLERNLV